MSKSTNSQNSKVEENLQNELKINQKIDQNKGEKKEKGKINKIVQIPRKVLILSLVLVCILTLCSFGGLIYLQNSSKSTSKIVSNNSSNSQNKLSSSEQKSIKSKDYLAEMWKDYSP